MNPGGRIPALLTLSFLVLTATARAQHIIQGKITNPTGAPVPTAIVVLEAVADSSIVQTTLPDDSGKYSITAKSLAATTIKVTATGFAEQRQQVADTAGRTQIINFTLAAAGTELGAVTVTAAKPLFERKIDRTVFNVSASIAAIGGNALDAVKKSPGVIVRESDNSIALAGKNEVRVMVNDRLIELSGEDLIAYLQAIPAENIDRIEVITTPPAQYDAAGNSGLINVVLKKNNRNGMNGEVRAGYEQAGYGTAIGGGNINFRKGGLNLYGNASYSDGSNDVVERMNTYYPDQDLLLSDPYRRDTRTLQYTLGADYELSKSGVLGIQLIGTDFNREYVESTNLELRHRSTGMLDSLIHSNAVSHRINQNNLLNVNYAWHIDSSGKKLTVNANRLWFDGSSDRDYDTQNYYGMYVLPTGASSRNQNRGTQQIRITTAQADMELPYKWANLSLGGKLSFSDNDSRNNFLYFEAGDFHNDPSVSNEFHYTERVQALYASAKRTFGHWDLQAGLRGEWTQTSGYSVKLAQTNTNEYFNLFPTAYAQYAKNETHVFSVNYSERINRPGYRALDPYRSYSSPYSYIEGNPFLRPGLSHNAELNYTLKGKYTFTAFYQYEPGTFGQVFFVDTVHTSSYVRNENYGDAVFYGINATGSFNPLPVWETQVQAGGSIQRVHATYTTAPQQDGPVPTGLVVVSNSFTLNHAKTLLAQANVFYISQYQNDLLRVEPQCNVDAGIKALLLDKKLVISLNGNDLLRTLKVRGVNTVTGQTLNSYFDARNVRLMINYKFGNSNIKGKRERSTGIEEERNRT